MIKTDAAHPERATFQQPLASFRQVQQRWWFHLPPRCPVPVIARQAMISRKLDKAHHSGGRMKDGHVFKNGSSVIGDDDFSGSGLNLYMRTFPPNLLGHQPSCPCLLVPNWYGRRRKRLIISKSRTETDQTNPWLRSCWTIGLL